jgi:integrase
MRLQPFDDPAFCARLLRLPLDLMERVRRQDDGSRNWALLAQSAVAIEILIMTAMRRGNLAGLDLERHAQWSHGRDRRVIRLFVPASEVKNKRRLDFPLTERTQRLIATYLKTYRPRLAATPSDWLFPGAGADHKGDSLLGAQVSRIIRRELGVAVHVHLFRHLAVKLIEHCRPGSLEIMRRVLGHSSLDTLLKYYADLQMAPAVRLFDEVVTGLGDDAVKAKLAPKPVRGATTRRLPAWKVAASS